MGKHFLRAAMPATKKEVKMAAEVKQLLERLENARTGEDIFGIVKELHRFGSSEFTVEIVLGILKINQYPRYVVDIHGMTCSLWRYVHHFLSNIGMYTKRPVDVTPLLDPKMYWVPQVLRNWDEYYNLFLFRNATKEQRSVLLGFIQTHLAIAAEYSYLLYCHFPDGYKRDYSREDNEREWKIKKALQNKGYTIKYLKEKLGITFSEIWGSREDFLKPWEYFVS